MKFFFALVILAFLGNSAFSQSNTGPANAMLRYANAAKSWDAERIAQLMHPEALQQARAAAPELLDVMAGAEYEIISEAERGDEVILNYVLIFNVEGQEIRQDVVQRLKQHDGEWLLMLPATAASTIAGIEARY